MLCLYVMLIEITKARRRQRRYGRVTVLGY